MNGAPTSIASAAPAIAMLAVACLIGGIAMMVSRGGDAKKGMLPLVMALVLLGNVVVWSNTERLR